jgi:hypothetical protein
VTENFRRHELSLEKFSTFFLFSDCIHEKALYRSYLIWLLRVLNKKSVILKLPFVCTVSGNQYDDPTDGTELR